MVCSPLEFPREIDCNRGKSPDQMRILEMKSRSCSGQGDYSIRVSLLVIRFSESTNN